MSNLQFAEVAGIVTKIDYPTGGSKITNFNINCPNMGKTFQASCDFYCPIRVHDTIYALCIITPDNKLVLSKPPFVQPPIDKNSIITCFMRAMKKGFVPCAKMYSNISNCAGGDENVISFLTGISQSYNDTKSADILMMMGDDPDDAKQLLSWWYRERNLRRLYLFGLTKKEINACRSTCDQIYQKCIENPYTLPAIPLDKCEGILNRLNKKPDKLDVYRGSIIRVMWKNQFESGWTGTPSKFIVRQFPDIKIHIDALKQDYGFIGEMETVYLTFPHKVENYIANFFIDKVLKDKIKYDTPLDTGNRQSAVFTRDLSEDQQKAIQGGLDHTISIITGGAGCGKTVCLGQIMHNLELRGVSYAVCAFTGKAVARIREVTKKRNPATIHRLISNSKKNILDKRKTEYEKDDSFGNYDHIIIDEASMVTTELLYDFLLAFPNIKKLTLVGDVNQLAPISWGTLLLELMKSETIPTYKLTTNYRVYTSDGERDGIILNANAIISHDINYPFEFSPTSNFNIIEGPIERVYDIINGCYRAGLKLDQVSVITPYNKDLEALNVTFQKIYNDASRFVKDSRGVKWMVGDKVMLTENDLEIGVFNGETGIIRDISNKAIMVDFGQSGCHEFLLEPTHDERRFANMPIKSKNIKGNDEVYDGDEGDFDDERTVKKLIHAYAITIDKSQGSEWDFIIVYISEINNGKFLNRNRIYTAITRAKRCCWIVTSDTEALQSAAVRLPSYRCENLSRRIKGKLPELKPYTINRPVKDNDMKNDNPDIPDEYFDNGVDCDDL